MLRVREYSAKLGRKLVVLDAGCGSMPYEPVFAKSGVCEIYHGADILGGPRVPIAIDAVTQKIEASDNSYDVVVHFQVLEHVPQPRKLLEECFRVLRPGGLLLCTIPFLFEYHAVPGDYHRWTDEGIKLDLSTVGFSEIAVAPIETQLESLVTLGSSILARRLGYFWTKPFFLACNLFARLFPMELNRVFTLTYICDARK